MGHKPVTLCTVGQVRKIKLKTKNYNTCNKTNRPKNQYFVKGN